MTSTLLGALGWVLCASGCAPADQGKEASTVYEEASSSGSSEHTAFSVIDVACELDARGTIHCSIGRPSELRSLVVIADKPFTWIDGDRTELLALARSGRVARVVVPSPGGRPTIEWLPGWLRATQVAFGVRSCALTAVGEVFCWDGFTGGTATPLEELDREPRRIGLPGMVVELRSHNNRTCARDEAGRVHCWGDIGAEWADEPVELFADAAAMAVNAEYVCAIVGPARRLECFGPALDRPLYPPPLGPEDDHVQASNLSGVEALFGAFGTCAVAQGWLWCDGPMREDVTLGAAPSDGAPPTPEGGPIRLAPVMAVEGRDFWSAGTNLCWTQGRARYCTTRLAPPWPRVGGDDERGSAP